jgi:hypothetical protein
MGLEIIPLPIQTFTIHVHVGIVVNKPMRGNEISIKEQTEPINPSFIVLDDRVESLEFLSTNLPLTPHHIGIG